MKPGTFGRRIVDLWDASVVWLAAVIIVGSVGGCAYLFLAPANAIGSPVPADGMAGMHMPTGHTSKPSPPADLNIVTDAKYGKILVDAKGRALYRLDSDPPDQNTCTEDCAIAWPAAMVTGTPVAGRGIDASKLTTVAVGNGTQLAYAGHPLYRYAKDRNSEDRRGQGALQAWWLVGPDGQEITTTAPNSNAIPDTKSSSGY